MGLRFGVGVHEGPFWVGFTEGVGHNNTSHTSSGRSGKVSAIGFVVGLLFTVVGVLVAIAIFLALLLMFL